MTKQKIWIDMTDLKVWSGHMTGVQRVAYQNAQRFVASNRYDAHCFVFNDVHNIFVEVSFNSIKEQIERAAARPASADAPAPASLKQRIKVVPRALVRRLPTGVKQRVPSIVKRGIRKSARLSLQSARRMQHTLRGRMQSKEVVTPVVFNRGDIVVIMGKSWDLPELMPTLGRLKQARGFKLVHLVHDLIPIFEVHLFGPGLFEPYTRNMFELCSISDGILTNSLATAKDVRRFCTELNIPIPPIETVRLADDPIDLKLAKKETSPHSSIVANNFILQVSTIEVRKNHQLVYMAYREAALRGIDLPTWVIMGSQGWLTGDVLWQMEHDPLVKDKIVILRGFPDSVRAWLYANCRFTVQPCTYEGWGLPVGESLYCGKVCITSKVSSMPEVGGKWADYISPYNSQELLETMVKYLDDKVLASRENEIKAGYKPTTWDDTFTQVESFVSALSK